MIDSAGSLVVRDTAGDAVIGKPPKVPEETGEATYSDDRSGGETLVGITTGNPV